MRLTAYWLVCSYVRTGEEIQRDLVQSIRISDEITTHL